MSLDAHFGIRLCLKGFASPINKETGSSGFVKSQNTEKDTNITMEGHLLPALHHFRPSAAIGLHFGGHCGSHFGLKAFQ